MECTRCSADIENPNDTSLQYVECLECGKEVLSVWFCPGASAAASTSAIVAATGSAGTRPAEPVDESVDDSDDDLDDAEALAQKQQSGKKRSREDGGLVGSAPNSGQSETKVCRNFGEKGKRTAKMMEMWKEREDLARPAKEGGKQKDAPHRIMGQARGTAEEEGVESEGEREEIMRGLEEDHEFDNHGCRESQKAMMKVAMMRKDSTVFRMMRRTVL